MFVDNTIEPTLLSLNFESSSDLSILFVGVVSHSVIVSKSIKFQGLYLKNGRAYAKDIIVVISTCDFGRFYLLFLLKEPNWAELESFRSIRSFFPISNTS